MSIAASYHRIVLVGALVVAAGCGTREKGRAPAPDSTATPAPPAPAAGAADTTRGSTQTPVNVSLDQLPTDSLLAHARRLAYDTTHVHNDEQFFGGGPGAGPLLTLQPEVGANRIKRDALARGLVVGRIVNQSAVPYPRLNLAARDTVYWWIDSTATGWRALFVSSAKDARPLSRALVIEHHADQPHLEPSARWLVKATGETLPWITCGEGSCCRT